MPKKSAKPSAKPAAKKSAKSKEKDTFDKYFKPIERKSRSSSLPKIPTGPRSRSESRSTTSALRSRSGPARSKSKGKTVIVEPEKEEMQIIKQIEKSESSQGTAASRPRLNQKIETKIQTIFNGINNFGVKHNLSTHQVLDAHSQIYNTVVASSSQSKTINKIIANI